MTSLLGADRGPGFSAWCMSWEAWLSSVNPGPIDFIKMDIEGGEFGLVPATASYLSTHTPILQEAARPAALGGLATALQCYGHRLEKVGRPVAIEDLFSDQTMKQHRSFLFLP